MEWYPIQKFDHDEPPKNGLPSAIKRGGSKGNRAKRKCQRAARRHNR